MLENESGPGSLHENTLLVVMGDHGQTLNGDHGGGSAEEVIQHICCLFICFFLINIYFPPILLWIFVPTSCRWKLQFLL